MATDKKFVVKNGLQAQNIDFVDTTTATPNHTITFEMSGTDTLSVTGDSGTLLSLTDSLTGTIFAVNDISGVPSIEVDDDGTIRLAETTGNVLIGTATDDGTNKLQVNGNISVGEISASGHIYVQSTTGIIFEGATDDAFETTLTVTDPTADRTITLPDATGTVLLTDGDGSNLTGIITDLIGDSTPQLGGNLDLNSNNITGTGNINITGTIDSTGNITVTSTSPQINLIQSGTAGEIRMGFDSSGTFEIAVDDNNDNSFSALRLEVDGDTYQYLSSSSGVNFFQKPILLASTANSITFEGATADNNETTLTVVDPTSDRTISLPDLNGTLVIRDSDNDGSVGDTVWIKGPGGPGGGYDNQFRLISWGEPGTGPSQSLLQYSNGSIIHSYALTIDFFQSSNLDLWAGGNGSIGFRSPVRPFTVKGGSPLVFEGATDDAFETTLAVTDPTADRTITLPNATGNVITTGNLTEITNLGVLTGDIVFEGATDDTFETTVTVTDPTEDRTVTIPDASGTVVLDSTEAATIYSYMQIFG